jgi:hypothetical protein
MLEKQQLFIDKEEGLLHVNPDFLDENAFRDEKAGEFWAVENRHDLIIETSNTPILEASSLVMIVISTFQT